MIQSKAFTDLTVLDFSRYLPGQYATQVFADMGARVIKVEDTGLGDMCRHDFPLKNGTSYYITALGRNKESVSFNLKDERAQAYLQQMAKEADIVVESFRPGVTKKLGVDYDTLKSINPGIIYCSITGYGEFDPRSKKASHDLNMQAASGYLAVNGVQITPMPLVDYATHSVVAQSLLAALHARDVTGEGAYVDISMFDCFVWWNSLIDSRWCFNGGQCEREDLDYPATAYNIYETKDGEHLAFGMVELKFWKVFCDAVGAPELLDAHLKRRWEAPEAFAKVEEIVKSKTLDEWVEFLADKDCCIEPVVSKADGIKRVLNEAPHMMRYMDFPQAGHVLQTAIPHHITSVPFELGEVVECSKLGGDTERFLKELGATQEEIDAMAADGAVCLGDKPIEADNVPVFPLEQKQPRVVEVLRCDPPSVA